MTASDWMQYGRDAGSGVVFILLLILWSGHKGAWEWGRHFREVKRQRDQLLEVAHTGITVARSGARVLEQQQRRTSAEDLEAYGDDAIP